MALEDKLSSIKSRHAELAALMSEGGLSGDEFTKLSVEYAELDPVVEAINALESARSERADLEEMLSDPEMKDMAAEELRAIDAKLPKLEHQIKMALIPKDEDDAKNAILEIRAGTGGDEAALFASDLFGMFKGYAAAQGWKFDVVEASESDIGGYKEIICEITGRNVFSRLKYVSGTPFYPKPKKPRSIFRIKIYASIHTAPKEQEGSTSTQPTPLCALRTYQRELLLRCKKSEASIRIKQRR